MPRFRRLRSGALVLVLLLCALSCAAAQRRYRENPAADARFAQGMALFSGGQYEGARGVFEELRTADPVNQRTTASYLMAAKTEFALHRYERVAPVLIEFFQRFPESSYQADAYYTLGMTSYVMHNYADAGRHLMHCVELPRDTLVRSRAAELLEHVAERFLSAENLRELYASARTPLAADLLKLKLAEKVYAAGEPSRARMILEDTTARGGTSPYTARINGLRARISAFASVRVGALLPLLRSSEPNATKILAEELLEGMTYALSEYKSSSAAASVSVTLDARDSGRDSATALRELEDLAKSPETVAVLGPVFSNLAFACAPAAEAAGLPLISPTATSNGLAAAGASIFQANPDFDTRGKAMAQFASAQLGLRRVAVLAPTEGVGRFVAESFLAEARRLGLQVVGTESYPPGVGDLREQCMRLRKTATAALRDQPSADSSQPGIDASEARDTNVDTPLTAIDGLFLPVSDAEDVGAIAPQIAFFNIKTQLLGSNEWYDAGVLNEHKRYVDGVMFVSDTYVTADDPSYAAFDAAYVAAEGKHPTKYSLYGYDAMRLVLEKISAGATGRKELARQLALVARYPGVHSKITLTTGRVNSEVHILQYSSGRVSEIGEVSVK
jgi:branched-chain amino acid transport system substrate-binding protein